MENNTRVGKERTIKMAMGATLRPKLIPGQEATRTCFLCFAAANENEAGSPVLYGVDVFLRANVNDGADSGKTGRAGIYNSGG